MKLYYAAASPFVRKVMATAVELGIADRIERISVATTPVNTDPALAAANPLGKIPALLTEDGDTLYDSPVICEYLIATAGDGALLPDEGAARWSALKLQAIADGLMDAAVLRRYEAVLRPEEKRWAEWDAGQCRKIAGALDALEAMVDTLAGPVTLGTIAVGCALGYLDFRFAEEDWRKDRPALAAWYEGFAQRPSMQQTIPAA